MARKSRLARYVSLFLSDHGKEAARRIVGRTTENSLRRNLRDLTISPEIAALHMNKWQLQSHRAKKELGYAPSITVDEGLARSVAWLRYAMPALRVQ